MFEQTLTHQQNRSEVPQQPSNIHQTPFYVFPTLENNKLLTLPGGELINGLRNAVTSHERNAIQIARTHDLAVKGRGSLILPKDSDIDGYGFVVEPAWKTTIPEFTDYTTQSTPAYTKSALELHDHHDLIERLKADPDRQTELALVRAFGDFVLTHHG